VYHAPALPVAYGAYGAPVPSQRMPEDSPPGSVPPSLFPSPLGLESARAPAGLAERVLPLVRTIRDYRLADLRPDFVAGLTTALFTVPQAMAYALIAGFSPAGGIATAVVASIFGAAFGSSEFLINGPTNAISVMLAAHALLFAASGDPVQSIVLLTLLIGVVQLIAAAIQVGAFTRFVSEPVLMGFTAGAGVYIVINQLPGFLGIEKSALVHDLWGWVPNRCALFDLLRLLRSLPAIHRETLGLAVLTFVLVRLLQRFERRLKRRLPATFLAVISTTLVVWLCGWDQPGAAAHVRLVRDIEPLTRSLPQLRVPQWDLSQLRSLLGPALAIGLMGSVEAIAIGKLLAARAGHPFNASRQLFGEAFCNLAAGLVGGFASSGSFSRTAVNFEAGAVTRISCILSGVLALLIVLAFAPQANIIPIAALAGTLVHVGLKLVDVAQLKTVFETTTADRVTLIVTFGAVLLAEHLENALFLGIAVSVYYALRRAEGFKLRVLQETPDGSLRETPELDPSQAGVVSMLNLQGELFFAAAEELQLELVRLLETSSRFIVLRVQEAYNLDSTTAQAIVHVAERARSRGGRLLLCGVRPGMYGTLERAGLLAKIGQDAIFPADRELLGSTRRALAYAHKLANADRPPEALGI
jgi:SulP family sulfate permease